MASWLKLQFTETYCDFRDLLQEFRRFIDFISLRFDRMVIISLSLGGWNACKSANLSKLHQK